MVVKFVKPPSGEDFDDMTAQDTQESLVDEEVDKAGLVEMIFGSHYNLEDDSIAKDAEVLNVEYDENIRSLPEGATLFGLLLLKLCRNICHSSFVLITHYYSLPSGVEAKYLGNGENIHREIMFMSQVPLSVYFYIVKTVHC
uniref:Uncharacterized protein n=1 Tax=Glossina pallidipes TaxID=7398 RepID=A0A1B0AFJ1_GLOPL